MASQRLTNAEREEIKKGLIKPLQSKIQEKLEEYGRQVIDPWMLRQIPQDVLAFDKLYPGLLLRSDIIYYNSIAKCDWDGLYIPVTYYIKFFFEEDDMKKQLRELKSTIDFIKEVESLKKQLRSLKNKLNCILQDISTYNKLKNEFPEAYVVLMGLERTEEISKCDSIENLRAELTKIK